jgi:hypothetical protein
MAVRWVASERNVADAPSRLYDDDVGDEPLAGFAGSLEALLDLEPTERKDAQFIAAAGDRVGAGRPAADARLDAAPERDVAGVAEAASQSARPRPLAGGTRDTSEHTDRQPVSMWAALYAPPGLAASEQGRSDLGPCEQKADIANGASLPARPLADVTRDTCKPKDRQVRITSRGSCGRPGRYARANAAANERYVACLFPGSHRVAHRVRAMGFCARHWGAEPGGASDLADPGVLSRLMRELRTGSVVGVMMAVPGSLAQAGQGELPARRATAVWRLSRECARRSIPCIIEAPWGADLWSDPCASELEGTTTTMDFCGFGARSRRRSCLFTTGIDSWDVHSFNQVCRGCGGWCSFNRRPHVQPGGSQTGRPHGRYEPYPPRLAQRVATVLVDGERTLRMVAVGY